MYYRSHEHLIYSLYLSLFHVAFYFSNSQCCLFSPGFFLLIVTVMYVIWIDVLDVISSYEEYQKSNKCPGFELNMTYGLSFMFAPVGVFFCFLSGLLFLVIGRTVQQHYDWTSWIVWKQMKDIVCLTCIKYLSLKKACLGSKLRGCVDFMTGWGTVIIDLIWICLQILQMLLQYLVIMCAVSSTVNIDHGWFGNTSCMCECLCEYSIAQSIKLC